VCFCECKVGVNIRLASFGLTSIVTFKPVFVLVNEAQVAILNLQNKIYVYTVRFVSREFTPL